jgi:hypothetical protein
LISQTQENHVENKASTVAHDEELTAPEEKGKIRGAEDFPSRLKNLGIGRVRKGSFGWVVVKMLFLPALNLTPVQNKTKQNKPRLECRGSLHLLVSQPRPVSLTLPIVCLDHSDNIFSCAHTFRGLQDNCILPVYPVTQH